MSKDDDEREELGRAMDALDEGDDDADEDPAEETPATRGTGHIPAPPAIAPKAQTKEEKAAAKAEAKKKRGRPSGAIGRIPEGVDSPFDAEMLWPQVIEQIQEKGRSTHEMVIRVARTSPGPYAPLGPLEASTVEGGGEFDPSPSDLLRDAIIDTFHSSQQGPAIYDVAFCWKRGATFYTRGNLRLPSMREIDMVRNNIARRNGQAPPTPQYPPARAPAPGVGAPPTQYAPQPHYAPPPPQHYAPTYQQQPAPQSPAQEEPIVALLREITSNQARLSARVEQIASGQHQAPQATPPPDPGGALHAALKQFAEAAEQLKVFGVTFTGPGTPGVGAPPPVAAQNVPPPPAAPPPKSRSDEEVLRDALNRYKKQSELKREIASAIGVTLPEDEPEDEETEEKKEEPEKPGLGFHTHAVPGAHWPDGSPMHHATDDKGNWDVGGLVLSNPYIIEKMGTQLLRIVEKIVPQGLGGQQQQPPQQEHLPEDSANGTGKQSDWKL